MKLDSKLFDAIRIRPRREEKPEVSAPPCAWEGCSEPGIYRAPKGHRAVGEYHHFCLEHVRHYNTAFNFFAGMNAEQVEEHINQPFKGEGRAGTKTSAGTNSGPRMRPRAANGPRVGDPLNIFARYAWSQSKNPQQERARPLHEPDRQAFETLGFRASAKSDEIKKAYKTLVKIHHPDANGGDKGSEDRLRAVIAAYTHLKAKGFVTR